MKKVLLFLVSMFLVWGLNAEFSLAGTDDFLAPKINPAAMAVGNSSGLSFIGNYDEDGIFEDYYSVIIADENLGYVLDRVGKNNYHRLALSFGNEKIFTNFSAGLHWDWQNKHFKDGKLAESFLYRPCDFLSFGAVTHDVFDDDYNIDLGMAVRPLILNSDLLPRLTFSADTKYADDDWSKPVLGVQTELIDGLRLGASYDTDEEQFGLNFGLVLDKLGVGTFGEANDDNKFDQGQFYVNLSEKDFRSFLNFRQKQFVELKMNGELLETKKGANFGPFNLILSKGRTLESVIAEINQMKNDEKVKGILFKSDSFSASLAARQELIDCLLDFKKSGKKIVFYDEGYGGSSYAFAAAVADQIYLNPSGYVEFRGLSATSPYLHSLLYTLGIDVINMRSHDYKTAGNMFSEDHMTATERESYEYLLEGIFAEIEKMVNEGRADRLNKPLRELIDETPVWNAEAALDNGLIDGVIYEDELKDKLDKLYQTSNVVEKYENRDYRYDWNEPTKEKVAVIYAIGNINSGKGKPGKSIGSVTTAAAIRKAREDKTVKGIILRVDSGGGSALASDVIAREVKLCHAGKEQKPFIVSMGGVAASGGYFISLYADKIVAQPATITGSIGVVGIMPYFERLYQKIHVNWDTVKIGKYSDFGNTNRLPREDEIEISETMIKDFYQKFISKVAEGRHMNVEDVHQVAQGRIWTGKQALDRGLVDLLGGMNTAKAEMQKMLHTKKEIDLVEYDGSRSVVSMQIPVNASTWIPEQLRTLWKMSQTVQQFEDDNIQMILPYVPEF